MLGSHDTFTYLKCESPAVELINKFWRCQKINIQQQYNCGVRFFDIRLMTNTTGGIVLSAIKKLFKKKKNKVTWACGHGLAEVPQTFDSVEAVCKYFLECFPDAKYRIILEKRNDDNKKLFTQQVEELTKVQTIGKYKGKRIIQECYPNCTYIGYKLPWTALYINYETYPQKFIDTCCRLFNWNPDKSLSWNIKNFRADWTIKNWAKAHNPKTLTKEQLNDPHTCYFMDYIGVFGPKII